MITWGIHFFTCQNILGSVQEILLIWISRIKSAVATIQNAKWSQIRARKSNQAAKYQSSASTYYSFMNSESTVSLIRLSLLCHCSVGNSHRSNLVTLVSLSAPEGATCCKQITQTSYYPTQGGRSLFSMDLFAMMKQDSHASNFFLFQAGPDCFSIKYDCGAESFISCPPD